MNHNKGFVYILHAPELDAYKIGVSKDVDKRIKQLQTGNTCDILLVDKFLSNYPYKIESCLHRKYNMENVKGEWFHLSNEQVQSFKMDCIKYERNFMVLEEMDNPFFK